MTPYNMTRFTLVAPHVTNRDMQAPYPERVRDGLLAAGIDGWTEYSTVGWWRGKREPGTTFEIYRTCDGWADARAFAAQLGRIGRAAMPDQEAIQVTMDQHDTILWEA